MKLVLATVNKHKVAEIRAILGDLFDPIITMQEAGFNEEIEENGQTFAQNASIKAVTVMKATGLPALADDSGLVVDALDGRPGVYSARYAGVHGDDDANNDKVLTEMADLPDPERTARFCCSIALARPGMPVLIAEGSVEGQLLYERRGSGGFGYDPLFYIPSMAMTMAELSPEQKNAISHRSRALAQLREKLMEVLTV